VRVFKTRTLAKFTQRNRISDTSLVAVVERGVRGLIDAELGGHIIKQRVARPGEGKRGGFRLLIGFGPQRSIFLFGFAKNERENIADAELKTLPEIAATFLRASEDTIAQAVKDGTLVEVQWDGKG
jgi:hypothetical protein